MTSADSLHQLPTASFALHQSSLRGSQRDAPLRINMDPEDIPIRYTEME